jgi:hypothetical protein
MVLALLKKRRNLVLSFTKVDPQDLGSKSSCLMSKTNLWHNEMWDLNDTMKRTLLP